MDPDITYDAVGVNGSSNYSKLEQLHDKVFDAPVKRATLESNRWLLDGSSALFPDDPQDLTGQLGYLGNTISGAAGTFAAPPWVQLNVRNLSVLQACSVHFTGLSYDGIGSDFKVEIYSGGTVAYTKTITGNQETAVYLDGFTVENVSAIRVTVLKWSLPWRFARLVEIVPGIYESWDGDTIYSIDVLQQTAFNCMTTPYGSCTLQVHNKNKRFNPYNPSGLFRSIQERQPIPIAMGVETGNGPAFLPLGVYYQKSGGWETDAYGLTITFKLVDIIGLLAERKFIVPAVLPTMFGGWLGAIVSQLGAQYADHWTASSELAAVVLTADAESLQNVNCGALLRYACMAACACFRADNLSGELLAFRPSGTEGTVMDEDNMSGYPKNQPTDDIADLTFRLADAEKTEHVVSGAGSGDKSLSISNPFLHTAAQAEASAAFILRFYGTTQFTTTSRGDMRSELGDVDTVATGFGTTAVGRRYKQQFRITNGVMKDVQTQLLEVKP